MKINKLHIIICTLVLLASFSLNAQSLTRVDEVVEKYPNKFKDVETLAAQIKKDFDTDLERARACYAWVAKHISYDVKALERPAESISFSYTSEQERIAKEQKIFDDLAIGTLKHKKAVCQGYATLFKKLCDLLKIEAVLISGSSKTTPNEIGEFIRQSDHAWNAIKINKKWYLVDATWGAGYVYNDKFNPFYSDVFFMQDPNEFYLKHYPDDKKWLLTNRSFDDFRNEPLFYESYFRYNVKLIKPSEGIIHFSKTDKLHIKLELKNKEGDFYYNFDSDPQGFKLPRDKSGKYAEFEIEIKNKMDILNIYYNTEAIISFKIIK